MTWIAWLFERATLLWGMWLLGLALKLVENALFVKRVYRSSSNQKIAVDAIDALNFIPGALKFGSEPWSNRMVPAVLFRYDVIAFTQVLNIGIHGDCGVNITVYRARLWGPSRGEPIIPDNVGPKHKATAKTITLLEKTSNRINDDSLSQTTELTLPLCGIDAGILHNSQIVANAITEHYKAGHNSARVYVIHGNPGCGKSTMLRLLTENINGVLMSYYNATHPSWCVKAIISDWATDTRPLVIAYEEFDVSFKHVVAETVQHHNEMTPDATDKASWNTMLDCIKRKTNVIFVMVTNKSYDEIIAMCNNDYSLLRFGRVDSHFVWPIDGKPPVRLDPMTSTKATEVSSADTNSVDDSVDDSVVDSVLSVKVSNIKPRRRNVVAWK